MALVLNTIPQIQKAIQDLYNEVEELKAANKPAEPVVSRRGRRAETPVEANTDEV